MPGLSSGAYEYLECLFSASLTILMLVELHTNLTFHFQWFHIFSKMCREKADGGSCGRLILEVRQNWDCLNVSIHLPWQGKTSHEFSGQPTGPPSPFFAFSFHSYDQEESCWPILSPNQKGLQWCQKKSLIPAYSVQPV